LAELYPLVRNVALAEAHIEQPRLQMPEIPTVKCYLTYVKFVEDIISQVSGDVLN
jgi:hypothetical protein